MAMRVRLKADCNIPGFPADVRVTLKALKTYGMFVADNGSDWYVNGALDPRWNDDAVSTLKRVTGSAFEAVKIGEIITR